MCLSTLLTGVKVKKLLLSWTCILALCHLYCWHYLDIVVDLHLKIANELYLSSIIHLYLVIFIDLYLGIIINLYLRLYKLGLTSA